MPCIAKNNSSGTDFKPIPEGLHPAICNLVVDLGVQKTTYMREEKETHQVYIRWELPYQRIEFEKDGEKKEGPMVLGETYTMSLNEKANLRKHLESWRGKKFTEAELDGFDLFKLLGVGCQITVVHNHGKDRTYQNIASIVAGAEQTARPTTTEVPILKYSEDDAADFDKLPPWLQTKLDNQVKTEPPVKITDPVEDFEMDKDIPF